jgi:FkbM family methyltransferase
MLATVKTLVKRIPFALRAYVWVCSRRRRGRRAPWRDYLQGRTLFKNHGDYVRALRRRGNTPVVLQTHDGLKITIRRNITDARIVREIFFDKPYLQYLSVPLRLNPTVVDIGGYIGDFTLYAARYLDAAHVVVYEPVAENFAILRKNVETNGLEGRVTAVNKAVSNSNEVVLNVQAKDAGELHVSAYWYADSPKRSVPAVTIAGLLEEHGLGAVDLLKIDCEGGEYDILTDVPRSVLDRIHNIVFEYHRIDGFERRLERVLNDLRRAGFTLRGDRHIVAACRA